ncbi:MAG TPA: mechanosensitive ion channel domain-containing protein [Verrucomicrobiae bacterium]|nr:mechanosensitive ion channel domain-containing protein [Verrucomicrobiae bacterium]
MQTNLIGHIERLDQTHSTGILFRVILIIALTLAAHFLVYAVRFLADWLAKKSAAKKTPVGFVTQQPKFATLISLFSSAITFFIYFVALGFVLSVFGFQAKQFLTTYLATASVIALAVGFGSQGLVQDVVTGITLILSDTLDVGDMIEIAGVIGQVERVGLRFTEVTNFYNQQVFLPNRMIGNIARFPRGGVHAYADVQIPAAVDRKKALENIQCLADAMRAQFSGIILSDPKLHEIEIPGRDTWNVVRVQFKIWPGQGSLIENTFRQQITNAMKSFDPNYADWMITVTYRAIATPREKSLK